MEQSPNKNNKDEESKISFFGKKKDSDEKKERFAYTKKFIGTENIQKNHEEIKNMATSLLSPNKILENARTENFKQAMERMGTTVQQLPKIHKNFMISFYVALAGFIFCLLLALHFLISGQGILAMLSSLAIASLCFANAFNFSFRCFQIKYRKLCSVKDYLNNKEFFPFPINK